MVLASWWMMVCNWLLITGPTWAEVVHGSNVGLPKVDYSKTFAVESFPGFNRDFETKSLEMKAVSLPTYFENLKPLPLTEWQSWKADIYPKTIGLHDFEIKKDVTQWSHLPEWSGKDSNLLQKKSSSEEKIAKTPSSPIETPDISPARTIGGEELKNLINRGNEVEEIVMGRGFGVLKINPSLRELPETKSLQK